MISAAPTTDRSPNILRQDTCENPIWTLASRCSLAAGHTDSQLWCSVSPSWARSVRVLYPPNTYNPRKEQYPPDEETAISQ